MYVSRFKLSCTDASNDAGGGAALPGLAERLRFELAQVCVERPRTCPPSAFTELLKIHPSLHAYMIISNLFRDVLVAQEAASEVAVLSYSPLGQPQTL